MFITNNYGMNSYYNQSFGADKISEHTVQRIYIDGSKEDVNADFVEFNVKDKSDQQLFDELQENDIHKSDDSNFLSDIIDDFERIKSLETPRTRFFGLVKHQKKYNKVKKDNILGMVEVFYPRNNNSQYIDFLQGFDDCKYGDTRRKYSGVGTSLLDGVADLTQKDIELSSVDEAIPFYINYGFIKVENSGDPNLMRYINNKKTL